MSDPTMPLTTLQCAKIVDLSARVIQRAVDTGDLKGYPVHGSLHRRIMPASLAEWMKRHGIPQAGKSLDPPPVPG